MFRPITNNDRLEYFARYTNMSLGQVKNLYLDWARLKGPLSPECQQLNRLFSQCVDGNRITIPPSFKDPPQPPLGSEKFILDVLHQAAQARIMTSPKTHGHYDLYTQETMQLLLSLDDTAISEFELIQLTHGWCQRNKADFADFVHYFDFNLLSIEEKYWVLNCLPPSMEYPSLVINALCQSDLLEPCELSPFKLHYPGLRWKSVYSSTRERLGTFLDTLQQMLELFHRKFIVFRIDERLTLAIYVPKKVERGGSVKLMTQFVYLPFLTPKVGNFFSAVLWLLK